MTSSLVGSEMCIRDSHPQVTSHHSECSNYLPPPTNHFPQPATTNHPVSYTHLTLPTICSV
eukprot:7688816-Prorocentrum_lima.AAC.1